MMHFKLSFTLLSFLITSHLGHASPIENIKRTDPVYTSSISQCPSVAARSSPPTSVHDLRPDDFSYAMALGDSITAGAFSRGIQSNFLASFSEWRGESYAGGGDPGAITIPNLIKNYNPSLTGGSLGSNPTIELCFGPLCLPGSLGWNSKVDQLNAAQSGALASNLLHEVRDYLVPQVKARKIPKSAFKYLNLQIGSNDICSFCFQSIVQNGPASPDDFEKSIRETLEAVRAGIPNTVVNILGVFKVSDVYTMTLNQPYCSQILPVPHVNIECPCMLLSGVAGNATRLLMDTLQTQYNERLVKIIRDYQQARYSDFAVLWQPANVPLSTYPVDALSSVDCFHPALKTHQLIASETWNRLVGTTAERSTTISWRDSPHYRCLQAEDRIHTDTLL
ncbi:hypothetical protein FRC20_001083 [Serendipita sp. 405]|nr:hypothetical protein FRC20_001083 [Serendipita sp. 405]